MASVQRCDPQPKRRRRDGRSSLSAWRRHRLKLAQAGGVPSHAGASHTRPSTRFSSPAMAMLGLTPMPRHVTVGIWDSKPPVVVDTPEEQPVPAINASEGSGGSPSGDAATSLPAHSGSVEVSADAGNAAPAHSDGSESSQIDAITPPSSSVTTATSRDTDAHQANGGSPAGSAGVTYDSDTDGVDGSGVESTGSGAGSGASSGAGSGRSGASVPSAGGGAAEAGGTTGEVAHPRLPACGVCGLGTQPSEPLLCSECSLPFHRRCVSTASPAVAVPDWLCASCRVIAGTLPVTQSGMERQLDVAVSPRPSACQLCSAPVAAAARCPPHLTKSVSITAFGAVRRAYSLLHAHCSRAAACHLVPPPDPRCRPVVDGVAAAPRCVPASRIATMLRLPVSARVCHVTCWSAVVTRLQPWALGSHGGITLASRRPLDKVLALMQPLLPPTAITHSHAPHLTFGRSSPRLLRRLIRILELSPASVVLDVGSGDGFVPVALSLATGCRALGVEVVEQRHNEATALLHSVCRLPDLRRDGLKARVHLRHGDALDSAVLSTLDLQPVTVVFCNNFRGLWMGSVTQFQGATVPVQAAVFEKVWQAVLPGTVVVSTHPMTARSDPAARHMVRDCVKGSGENESFEDPNLYFLVKDAMTTPAWLDKLRVRSR